MALPRKEVLYEGYYYDVTDFIWRHPGGEAILDYHTTPGEEDATIPIQQFHNRNFNKVKSIMKSLKRRPVDDDIPTSTSEMKVPKDPISCSARNKALTLDYLKLFREATEEGLFDPDYAHVTLRLVEPLVLALIAVIVLNTNWAGVWWGGMLTSSLILGLAKGRATWLSHEAGHKSLTGKPKLDAFLSSWCFGLGIGVSAEWWMWYHPQHHAMTNRLHRDLDLDLDPFMNLNVATVKKGRRPNFFMRYQKYFLPLNGIFTLLYWKTWHTGSSLFWKRTSLAEMIFIPLHYYLSWKFLPLPTYLIAEIFMAWYIYAHLGMSHSFLPVRTEPCHWVEAALLHTADFQHTPWVDWWMGYLNYQIEHHLFPTMPYIHQRRIVGRVKGLAVKHGLPYHLHGYWEGLWAMSKNVHEVELKMRSM